MVMSKNSSPKYEITQKSEKTIHNPTPIHWKQAFSVGCVGLCTVLRISPMRGVEKRKKLLKPYTPYTIFEIRGGQCTNYTD